MVENVLEIITYLWEVCENVYRWVGVLDKGGNSDHIFVNLQGPLHPPGALLLEGLQPEDDGILKPQLVVGHGQTEHVPWAVEEKQGILIYGEQNEG